VSPAQLASLAQTVETACLMQTRVASDLKRDHGPLAKVTMMADGVVTAQCALLAELRERMATKEGGRRDGGH